MTFFNPKNAPVIAEARALQAKSVSAAISSGVAKRRITEDGRAFRKKNRARQSPR